MECFVVYAADDASFTVLRGLLVNGEVKETMEAFGLGVGNRDICERVCHPSLNYWDGWRLVIEVIDSQLNSSLFLANVLSFLSNISQSDLKVEG